MTGMNKVFRFGFIGVGLFLGSTELFAGSAPTTTNVVSIGAASHEGNGIAVDSDGNIYLTGQHVASRYDGATATRYGELGGVEYEVVNYTDFFLMKLDADLNVLWTRVGGSARYDYGTALRVASNGDVLVVAAYQDQFEVGGHSLTNITQGRTDSFVARYDASGNLLWHQVVYGAEDVTADDVELDSEGSVYIAGRLRDVATFGETEVGQRWQNKVFLAKYSGAGEFQWARAVESTSSIGSASLTVDASGTIVVGGTLSAGGYRGCFLAGYDSLGNQSWLTRFNTGSAEELSDVAVDAAGNLWFSGRFSGSTFDLGNGVVLTNSGTFYNGYIAKTDSSRTAQWAASTGSRGYEFEPDANGDLIVAGYHQSPYLDFAGQPLVDGQGGTDAFIGGLSPGGDYCWNASWSSTAGERCRAVAIAPDGSIVATGEGNTLVFGSEFSGSVFVAKLGFGQQQEAGPVLNMTMAAGDIRISWPVDAGSFGIEAATNLGSAFFPITATPVDGQTNTYSVPATNDALFIRLKEIP